MLEFTFGGMYSVGLDECMTHIPHPYTEVHREFHCPENPLCSVWSFFPCSLIPGTTDLFTVSIVLPFTECVAVEVRWHVAFSDLLLSLSNR